MNILIISLVAFVGVASVSGDCNCGWANSGRIVGGVESRKNAYPFVVALVEPDGFQFCGGTIITTRHVLSAAHCFIRTPKEMVRVKAGAHDLNSRQGALYEVLQIKEHERFNYNETDFDISLVVTKNAIKFDQNVGPACLPSARLSLIGQNLKALGWGDMWDRGISSDVLREVDLKVISFKQCQRSWLSGESHPVEAHNVCTFTSKKDTCQGDSGGPLIWLNPKTRRYTLAALVSFGDECAGPLPAVNTDVSGYLPWIHKNIAGTVRGMAACVKG